MAARIAVFSSRSLARALLVLALVVQVVFVSTSSSGANSHSDNSLLELTSETFQAFVTAHGTTVVEFYQPWCGTSVRLQPSIQKLAATFKSQITFARVNVFSHPAAAERFQLRAYPVFGVFTYRGAHSFWLTKKLSANALFNLITRVGKAPDWVQSSSSLRAIVNYEDVVVAICVQESQRTGHDQQAGDAFSDVIGSPFESAPWNFTSADAAALDKLGAWPLLDSNPFLQNLLHTRVPSVHASQDQNVFSLSHDAPFYHSLVTSIQDKFRFVFVPYNPTVRGSERPCLRATQCTHPGCMSLLRAGLRPVPISIASVTRLIPSSINEPWMIVSASEAHTASAAELSQAANKIAEWANVGAQFRLLEELTQENFALYTFARPAVIFFTGVADSHNVAIKRVLRAAAAKFLHRVRFGHLNGLRYHGLALKMGSNHPAPSIILVNSAQNFSSVFPRNEAVSLSNIDRWVSSHLAGKLDPTLRSGAGADEKWLQASHWQEQLQQNSQNMKFTLVAFTARWCGFCKSVPPLVRIIDEILSQEALPVDVKLFDVDVNDAAVAAAHVNVTSVPTLILIPPVLTPQGFSNVYTGPLAVHDCLDFVRKEVTRLLEQHQL